MSANGLVGFACAYTPLPVIDAAGLVPFRVLPVGDAPDQAGSLLHDNLCPHVKRVLDRAMADDLPDLLGVVLMNSCDAMRRLVDAWAAARPADRAVLVDLPADRSDASEAYFRGELVRLAKTLSAWSGRSVTDDDVRCSIDRYNELAQGLARLDRCAADGTLRGGRPALQALLNRSVTRPLDESLAELGRLEPEGEPPASADPHVPVFLFGNVLPDAEAFELFEACGARVIADDLCTGSRQIAPLRLDGTGDVYAQLARALLSRPPCARTVTTAQPGMLAESVLARARECGAKGVIAHVMKFCDPYLARLPMVRRTLRDAGVPLLVLEGDCTLRSLGQHRTRIEAFVEMLGGSTP